MAVCVTRNMFVISIAARLSMPCSVILTHRGRVMDMSPSAGIVVEPVKGTQSLRRLFQRLAHADAF